MDFDLRTNKYGIFIQFEDVIETIETSFVIDTRTMLTRIGGTIGVGKEFLWIILFGGTALKFLQCFGLHICFKNMYTYVFYNLLYKRKESNTVVERKYLEL